MIICRASFVVWSAALALAVSFPTNTTDPTSPSIPREFPKFSQNYTFVDNSSIRENLASHAGIDTEVEDLLGEDEKQSTKNVQQQQQEENVVPNPSELEENTGRKSAVEWIENGEDTEDNEFSEDKSEDTTTKNNVSEETTQEIARKEETNITEKQTTVKEFSTESGQLEPYKDGVPVLDGTVAAILVGIFLVICIFGYTALILWRRSLELKYGSREMLVDKDDMFDPDDLKHFSI